MSKLERSTLKKMSPQVRTTFNILNRWETDSFIAIPELCKFLEKEPIQFVTFSCLGTNKKKEELKLDLEETFFFRYRRHLVAEKLLGSLGIATELMIILPDTEPIRTWGWKTPQEEVSECCIMMVEDKTQILPSNWKIVLWSEIEKVVTEFTYDDALIWARKSGHPLVIKEEVTHLLYFPNILMRRNAEEVALRQVAAYALEGRILEQFVPQGILLQSEFPIKRKDGMYQPLRLKPLPIIHPFNLPKERR